MQSVAGVLLACDGVLPVSLERRDAVYTKLDITFHVPRMYLRDPVHLEHPDTLPEWRMTLTLDKRSADPYIRAELMRIADWVNAKQLGTLGGYRWLILALGLGAGLRGFEMDHLTWKQVEVDGRVVVLRDVGGRDVPVHHEWADVLAEAEAGVENVASTCCTQSGSGATPWRRPVWPYHRTRD